MEYAGKVALCKSLRISMSVRARALATTAPFVSDMVRDDAILGINASGFADFDGNGTGRHREYGFPEKPGEKYQDA